MGIKFYTATPAPGTGPILPEPLHTVGVDGWTRRFAAERLSLGALTEWPDAGGDPHALENTSTGGVVTVTDESGLRFVHMDNGNDGTLTRLGDGIAMPNSSYTLAMAFRKPVTSGTDIFLQFAGTAGSRLTNGSMRIQETGAGSDGTNALVAGLTLATWHLGMWVIDTGTNTGTVRLDGTAVSTTGGTFVPGTTLRDLLVYAQGYTSIDIQMDIAEIVIWPTALTSGQQADVRTALKARYATLA